jgi:hypothetical protein
VGEGWRQVGSALTDARETADLLLSLIDRGICGLPHLTTRKTVAESFPLIA